MTTCRSEPVDRPGGSRRRGPTPDLPSVLLDRDSLFEGYSGDDLALIVCHFNPVGKVQPTVDNFLASQGSHSPNGFSPRRVKIAKLQAFVIQSDKAVVDVEVVPGH
jgi:hypothetical protein